jgi:hypothetical protein
MSIGTDSTKKLVFFGNWRVLLVGAVLGSVITAGAFAVFPLIVSKGKPLKWADWTGFGEGTTISTSTEKNTKGQIQKITTTEQPQPGKTLWDVLALVLVPGLLAWLSYQFQQMERKRADEQAKAEKRQSEQRAEAEKKQSEQRAEVEREIASANLREEALQAYLKIMSELLLNGKLDVSDRSQPGWDVARAGTLAILRRLGKDGELKGSVIRFLIDADLVSITAKSPTKLNLSFTDLTNAQLSRAKLSGANLSGANLSGVNLSGANLWRIKLNGANLASANLSDTSLRNAGLSGSNLKDSNLKDANLKDAYLLGADLSGADLSGADLKNARLQNAKNLNLEQVKAAKNWAEADYSPEFRQRLGLPPESPQAIDQQRTESRKDEE